MAGMAGSQTNPSARADSRGFRAAREADWARLEDILQRAERKSVKALPGEDLLALPVLYRGALLHSGIIPPDAVLSSDPRKGRLTANLFGRGR